MTYTCNLDPANPPKGDPMSTTTDTPFDLVGEIIAFETGEMESEEQVIALFQHLVTSGMAWTLQGSYGRTARDLIEAGLVTP